MGGKPVEYARWADAATVQVLNRMEGAAWVRVVASEHLPTAWEGWASTPYLEALSVDSERFPTEADLDRLEEAMNSKPEPVGLKWALYRRVD